MLSAQDAKGILNIQIFKFQRNILQRQRSIMAGVTIELDA
jgi:hypothetical protein